MSNNTQPEIRFPGFTEDWEQRKLGDFIDVKSGKDYKHLNSGSIPVYGTGGYMLSVDRALSDIDAIGIGRKGTIDKPYLLKAPFWTVDTLFYAVPKQNIDLQFSLSIFKKINWKKFDESTGVPSLSKTVINSVGASVPSYEEQQKIGSFFKQLDETIALHQHKLDLLKETKKGFLQKMFPKNGAKVPEIRFSGFTEDWEQRKLKYIFKYRQGQQVPVENQYFESGENRQKFIRIVDLTQKNEVPRYIEYFGENIIQKDDLFMIRYGQPGIVGYGYNGVIANNLFRLIPKISINNLFFYFILQGMFPMISKLSSSTTMPALSFNSLDLLEVKFPSSLIEQQKIGSFFKQLDDIITLHQRKLDLLKETKKGFLQKMFV
ncbi:restriction endonuclease subunit S [Enterococcus faecium]|uniref:restriction endonuclease subunit S n=1 Tax=Enterococcus faecium TaxID=1352 RepID=UPI000F4F946C|nr:restriction endonuclease subunit S [Enterococcus faecium]MDT2230403.1 restriction endonuclease subunit S [Enterococcus faecium]ROX52145.1 restriction endonuclease subunit S [Enterococcus faecium]